MLKRNYKRAKSQLAWENGGEWQPDLKNFPATCGRSAPRNISCGTLFWVVLFPPIGLINLIAQTTDSNSASSTWTSRWNSNSKSVTPVKEIVDGIIVYEPLEPERDMKYVKAQGILRTKTLFWLFVLPHVGLFMVKRGGLGLTSGLRCGPQVKVAGVEGFKCGRRELKTSKKRHYPKKNCLFGPLKWFVYCIVVVVAAIGLRAVYEDSTCASGHSTKPKILDLSTNPAPTLPTFTGNGVRTVMAGIETLSLIVMFAAFYF
ncbi:hypothetical protein T439DRAFT_334572 [Meredithblackwellia eburnea MCA 4105]